MKKYMFFPLMVLFLLGCGRLVAQEEVSGEGGFIYGREGNKIVEIEAIEENVKKCEYLKQKLSAMDANLAVKLEPKKEIDEVIILPPHVAPETVVNKYEFHQHIFNPNAHHPRYTDAEAIAAVQEAIDISFKDVRQINPEGRDVKFFEDTMGEVNAGIYIYGKGFLEERADKYGMFKIDEITGDFIIKNSSGEEISIEASSDLNLNISGSGDVVLFRNNLTGKDKHIFIYGTKSKTYSSLGYISGTDNFQIANSKEGGDILLVTKGGNVLAEGTLMTNGNIYVNCQGPDRTSYVYFYEDGKPDGAFIKYSDENRSFEFSPTGFDIAEKVAVDEQVTSGDVIVFGEDGRFRKATQANSRNVVGVISSNPAIIIGGQKDGKPLALCGQVEVKVCGENGDIKVGDFLTSSNLPGYAMKSTEMLTGSILGQAMEEFSGDKGVIKMVVKMR